jgi:hypothetical protein
MLWSRAQSRATRRLSAASDFPTIEARRPFGSAMPNIYKFSIRIPPAFDPTLTRTRAALGLSDLERWRD